jgi:regulator of ribonuclease activity A
MTFTTVDLCDRFSDELQVAEPRLRNFGGAVAFHGPIATIDTFEDSALMREALESEGRGRVLVVDSGGSILASLLGKELASLASGNGWSGIVLHGCVRNVTELAQLPIGIRALAASPRASRSNGRGTRDIPVHFAGITFRAGHYLYADADGILVAPRNLLSEQP